LRIGKAIIFLETVNKMFNIKNSIQYISNAQNFVIDLLFPRECLGCGVEGIWFCQSCQRQLTINNDLYCLNCNKSNQYGKFCKKCAGHFYLDGVWVAGDYNDPALAKLIKMFKYRFIKDIKYPLGLFLSIFLKNLINQQQLTKFNLKEGLAWRHLDKVKKAPDILFSLETALLIPVPLSKKRKRWRGFNQASELAYSLAKHFHLTVNEQLKRTRHRQPQAKLDKTKRQVNIVDCFVWQGRNLKGRNIILIDDVSTTGSTLNECARTLKKYGAKEIWGLVVAHGS